MCAIRFDIGFKLRELQLERDVVKDNKGGTKSQLEDKTCACMYLTLS